LTAAEVVQVYWDHYGVLVHFDALPACDNTPMPDPLCPADALTRTLADPEALFDFLRGTLDWNIDPAEPTYFADDDAVGRAAARATVRQIVPFAGDDPFVIFHVAFVERFRRGDLREILRAVRARIREVAAYRTAALDDLVFVCTFPDGVRFAHFEEPAHRQPRLRVFGYDRDTVGETFTLRSVNLPLLRVARNVLGEVDWRACEARWREAWDVEKVTRQFFADYRAVFETVEASCIKNAPGDKRLFTQRFFNRLMFVHFLSKKGWLRAPGKTSGATYLDDLYALYKGRGRSAAGDTDNFYRRHLAPLFFLALNMPPGSRPDVVVTAVGDAPYLNGGLFEQTADDKAAFVIEDAAFMAIWERLFSCYNFTVAESTPDDADVAVDPEMLGKVFEELVTDRHGQGAYYTPRPVVQFMCREALKGYLAGFDAGDVSRLVDYHDGAVKNARRILARLDAVKVVDPACGSGAYLLGMLQELMAIKSALFKSDEVDDKEAYAAKLEIIQNNLYGVDLDPFAVNTARLRLWLSLVVEDRRDPLADPAATVALPNLDFKIEIGDSVSCPDPSQGAALSEVLVEKFVEAKERFGNPFFSGDKKTLRDRTIPELRAEIAGWEGRGGAATFDWRVDFCEVFQPGAAPVADLGGALNLGGTLAEAPEAGGFDIVLANPPYVRSGLIPPATKLRLRAVYGNRFDGNMDLYCFFYFRAMEMLKPGGQIVFITSSTWFRAGYGEKLRAAVAATCWVRSITDFGELPVFETAATFPMIFVAQKGKRTGVTTLTRVKTLAAPYPNVRALIAESGFPLPSGAITGSNWSLMQSHASDRLRQMERAGIPLSEYVEGKIYYGIKTGFNKAFVIKGSERDALIKADPKSAELIKPLAVGDDIRRWRIENQDMTGKHLIVTKIGVTIDEYPAIFAHLKKWETELKKRVDQGSHWWELRACAYYDAFSKGKIIFPDIGKEPRFAFDENETFTNDTTFIVAVDDKFLLGVFNSHTFWEYMTRTAAVLGDEEKGGRMRLKRQYIVNAPIPNATETQKSEIAALVQQCLDKRGVGVSDLEAAIDARVSALYGLS